MAKEIVELVQERIDAAEARLPTGAIHHVALLALFDLAEEYVQAKRRTAKYKKTVDEKSGELFSLLESELK